VIARGVPSAWLEPTKRIEVTDAPTLFGPVSYRIEAKDSSTAVIHFDAPSRMTPRELRLHLRHPNGLAIAEVKTSSVEQPVVDGQVIRLPKPTGSIDLTVSFRAPK
jgi:hypothetical protein